MLAPSAPAGRLKSPDRSAPPKASIPLILMTQSIDLQPLSPAGESTGTPRHVESGLAAVIPAYNEGLVDSREGSR